MSKQIQLSRGKYAIVDDEDFEYLNQWKWYARKDHNTFYAFKIDTINGIKKSTQMHRLILSTPNEKIVDHKNGNGLDNRRTNIRNCDFFENSRNCKTPKTNTSGFKGVHFHKNKWCARIKVFGSKKHLGYFEDKVQAAKAYNAAALKYHGEFANLNQIPE